jgi:hypothetical protein
MLYACDERFDVMGGRGNIRDENDRKRSIGGQITFVFTSFSQKRNRYDIVGNEYGADIPVISKMIVVDQKIHR